MPQFVIERDVPGVHLLTDAAVTVNRKTACNLTAHLSTCAGTPGGETWTGRELMSCVLPQTLHVAHGDEVIEFGVLKDGQLRKDSYQRATTGILQSVYNDDGPDRAVRLLDDTQHLTCDWLMAHGFSVGIGDLIGRADLAGVIAAAGAEARARVDELLQSLHTGAFESDPFLTDSELVESKAQSFLGEMFDVVGKASIADSKARGSRLLAMIDAGSKGKTMNVCQMVGSLGQQDIERARVPLSFEGRVLPHFDRYDDGCEARGLVESSFLKGLQPAEFFMHAMAGREGLIDTAVKSVTGDTPVVFMEDGAARYARIGDWIDARLAAQPGDVRHFEARRMELLDLDNDVFIPTTDYDGVVTWGRVTAMTRHNPGTELYAIRTASGKRVVVTESKSLLIWKPDMAQFREVLTPEIRVGDCVPVTADLPGPPVVSYKAGWTAEQGRAYGARVAAGEDIEDGVFAGPTDFVEGVLAGFFYKLVARPSPRTADGVAMLFSRLGVFAAFDKDGDVVFGSQEDLARFAPHIGGYPLTRVAPLVRRNGVVLDPIVGIEVVGVAEHPKVYDLTIPSTLNFGLANGLQVRDTSETGYLQRKLIKALEDCKTGYDRSVRMPNGSVVQFMYGEDGMDACSIEINPLPLLAQSLDELARDHLWTRGDDFGALLSAGVTEALSTDGEAAFARLEAHFRELVAAKDMLRAACGDDAATAPEVMHSIAFDRLLTAAARAHSHGAALDLHPVLALDTIDGLVGKMGVGPHPDASPMLAALVRAYLSPKVLVQRYRMNAAGLEAAEAAIEAAFLTALCSPSEMVGILAAQSIAEPLTQMVLNTFHTTGMGAATKTLEGVPRIKELLGPAKNPKTPVMRVFLRAPTRVNALLLRDRIRATTVQDVMLSTSLVYDPSDYTADGPNRLAALYAAFQVSAMDPEASPWLLRIQFDRAKMIDAAVHMHDVHRAITEAFVVGSLHTDDGCSDLIMRLRIPATSADMMSELVAFEEAVLATRVSGLPDVKMAHEFEDDSAAYDPVTRSFRKRDGEWCLTTQGTNFREVLSIDGVDQARTTTNVISEIVSVLGIEAARAALLMELKSRYSKKTSSYVNHRHISLLVDYMVQGGGITAIDRFGINRGDIGPLAKCSFEQPVENLVNAAVFRESDKVEGVSASIMLGQVARCGTGDGDLILDAAAYADVEGDRAPLADLRNETDQQNEPALDALLALSFTGGASTGLAFSPAATIAAIAAH